MRDTSQLDSCRTTAEQIRVLARDLNKAVYAIVGVACVLARPASDLYRISEIMETHLTIQHIRMRQWPLTLKSSSRSMELNDRFLLDIPCLFHMQQTPINEG